MKRVLTIPAMLVVLLAASLFVQAQQQEKPKREPGAAAETGKHHVLAATRETTDRKSTRLNSSHSQISYAVFCLKKKKKPTQETSTHSSHKLTSQHVARTI